MRGKGDELGLLVTKSGITPAYAGKSCASFCVVLREKDHPRVCGEKQDTLKFQPWVRGSPPRMRGKGERR